MKSICSNRSPAIAIFISCLALGLVLGTPAYAKRRATAVASPSHPPGSAVSLLAKIEDTGGNQSALLALAKKLASLTPSPVADLKAHLARKRRSSVTQRRAILVASGADVPDASGRFRTPARQTAKEKRKKDNFDWLPALAKERKQAGLGEVLSDVAAIRALAASTNPEAGTVLLQFAFRDEGLIYRDECGRYLRKMSPYSLPSLISGSQNRKNRSIRRYADYQLERLDRQNAHKAFDAAPTEDLKIAIVTAFAKSQYREAVFAVLENVDYVAPRVRKATRDAWMEYISGRAPPKPPERKLKLPNGKETEEVEALWLDHRALADTAIRALLNKLTGHAPPKRASLVTMTEKLFSFYDERRAASLDANFESGLAAAQAGKTAQAVAVFDRILAQDPAFEGRQKMFPAYLAKAEALAKAEQWQEAAAAYGKASAMAPQEKESRAALKKHHLARARAARAAGLDDGPLLAVAASVTVGKDEADVAKRSARGASKEVIRYGGIAALAASLLLLLLGLAVRRRSKGSS